MTSLKPRLTADAHVPSLSRAGVPQPRNSAHVPVKIEPTVTMPRDAFVSPKGLLDRLTGIPHKEYRVPLDCAPEGIEKATKVWWQRRQDA